MAEGHDLANDTLKMALYTSSASLDATTTAYSATNEVSGTGYTAGGAALTATAGYPQLDGSSAIMLFDDVTWSSATISGIAGALIYNTTNANKAVAVINFGTTYAVSSGDFTVKDSSAAPFVKITPA